MLLLRFSWEGREKIVFIFYLSILVSIFFNLYSSSGDPVLRSQVDDSTVWGVKNLPVLDYIIPFLSYSDLFGALENNCDRDYKG